MKPDRSAIMKDARRRYLRRLRWGEDVLTWSESLRRAWAAWRLRHANIGVQMQKIAEQIRGITADLRHHDESKTSPDFSLHRCF